MSVSWMVSAFCLTAALFPSLADGERKLVVDSLIREVSLKHKEVAVCLTPPLASLRLLSTELAPKEEKPKVPELIIYLAYNLVAYSGAVPALQTAAAVRVATQAL